MAKDKAAGAPATQIAIDASTLENFGKQITDLDARIAAASGSDAAGKKAWIEKLISDNQSDVDGYASSIIEQIGTLDLPLLVGLVTKLEERMKADLLPKVNEYVDTEYPKTKTTEDVEGLRNTRKELIVQFKALRAVLDSFGIPNDHIEDPKRSGGGGRPAGSGGGSGAKSGANKEGYRYAIDGKDRPPSQNSFSSVAFYATNGVPEKLLREKPEFAELDADAQAAAVKALPKKWGAAELKTFVKEQTGAEFGSQDTWTVTLPNGKVVSARRYTDQDKIELGIVDDANETGTTEAPVEETVPAGV